jgi:hypothetical protein
MLIELGGEDLSNMWEDLPGLWLMRSMKREGGAIHSSEKSETTHRHRLSVKTFCYRATTVFVGRMFKNCRKAHHNDSNASALSSWSLNHVLC